MLQAITRWNPLALVRPQKPIIQALYSAHRLWAKRYPQWAAAFFDEHFLRTRFLPLLDQQATVTPTALAQAWVAQFYGAVRLEQQLVTELTPVAADFLHFLAGELRYFEEEARQPSAVSRLWLWLRGSTQRHTTPPQLPVLHRDPSCHDLSG